LHRVRFRQIRSVNDLLRELDHVQKNWQDGQDAGIRFVALGPLCDLFSGFHTASGISTTGAGLKRMVELAVKRLRATTSVSVSVMEPALSLFIVSSNSASSRVAHFDEELSGKHSCISPVGHTMALETLSARPRTQSGGAGLIQANGGHVAVEMRPEDADEDSTETTQLLEEEENKTKNKNKQVEKDLEAADDQELKKKDRSKSKTSYVAPSVVVFWLSMWFTQNIGVTFWNKKALGALRLPVTLTFVHMTCNTLGAFLYIHMYKGIERKPLKPGQKQLMVYFSLIFVSNIITGNWSLGLVSISFNQVMRALVPAVVVVLSMLILGKTYSLKRKLSLIPVAFGVYLACTGDNSCTMLGFIITVVAIVFAGLKAVLSSKFLTGDLKLHPVDLILHQAPLSACWCLITMFLTGEVDTIMNNWEVVPSASFWYILTGIISFMLNVTSFMANKVTSPVTLCVCGNMKQVVVIVMSIVINHDVITVQKAIGIVVVSIGGATYAYISTKETMGQTLPAPAKTKVPAQTA
ncbi:Drug/Metabolite Transporter, partial [Phytophthora megakarya]